LDDVVFVVEKPNTKQGEQNNPALDENTKSNEIAKVEDSKQNHQETLKINDTVLEKIPFGRDIIIYLPKGNIAKSWEKAQRYMKLYLEDYDEDYNKTNPLEKPVSDTEEVYEEDIL
jgi:hypothetical protein